MSPVTESNTSKSKKFDMEGGSDLETSINYQLIEVIRSMQKEELQQVATKSDMDIVLGEIKTIKKENENLCIVVKRLEAENKEANRRIEQLERFVCSKNLIFKNLTDAPDMEQEIKRICNGVLNIQEPLDIQSVHKINKKQGKTSAVVQFGKPTDISKVLSKASLLKGTTYGIDRDLTVAARKRRSYLLNVKRQILVKDSTKKVSVRGDELKIEGKTFHWRDGQLICGFKNGVDELSKIYNRDFSYLIEFLNKLSEPDNDQRKQQLE